MTKLNNHKWQASTFPGQLEYPFELAAKLIRDGRGPQFEDLCKLISATRDIYNKYKEQSAEIVTLQQELKIAEATVRLLQEDNF